MARLSFALPILDRCERPRTASVRAWRLQPGRLAQGPDEKCGVTGRTPGGLLMTLSFQIESPSVGKGGPRTEIRKDEARVKRARPDKPGKSVEQETESQANFVGRKPLPSRGIDGQSGAGRRRQVAQIE